MDFRELKEFIKDTLGFIIVIVVVILLKVYVITPTVVVGDSMKGTVNDGNWLLMEMVSTRFGNLKRYDVVVVKGSNPKYLVKRIIGLPGDRVKWEDNKLYINDQPVEEPYLKEGVTTDDMAELTVPKGEYFVVGDNRTVSIDSRKTGSVKRKAIDGNIIMKLWPIREIRIVK